MSQFFIRQDAAGYKIHVHWSMKVFDSRSSGSSHFLLIAFYLNGMWQEVTTLNITFHHVNPQRV